MTVTQQGSLTVLPDLVQGSDEWLEQRCGIVTASVVGRLITPATVKVANNPESRAITTQLAAERITGFVDPTYVSDDMIRGAEDEPIARDLYGKHYAPVTEVGFMIRDEGDWRLGYSPDGLVGDDGLIEIKSRRPKKHLQTILQCQAPNENMAQLQAALLVSGRKWIDYVSYCGGMPMWVHRVFPDEKWRAAIASAVEQVERAIEHITEQYEGAITGLVPTERIEHADVELKL